MPRKSRMVWIFCAALAAAVLGPLAVLLRPYSIAKFRGEGANLRGAMLVDAPLHEANLRAAALSRAFLFHAILVRAQLEDADLTSAVLIGANLTGADLTSVSLQGAGI